MKIAIFAAGTGGHIYPALSIAEKFGKENVIFIASNREIEKKIYKNVFMLMFKLMKKTTDSTKISFMNQEISLKFTPKLNEK